MSSSTMASRKARHEALTGWLFALPFTIVFIIVFVAPIIESIQAGFHKQVAEGGGLFGGGRTVEKFVGLENFQDVCTNPAFWQGIRRVMLFGVFQIPIMILTALLLALILDSYLVRHSGAGSRDHVDLPLRARDFPFRGTFRLQSVEFPRHPRINGQYDDVDLYRLQYVDFLSRSTSDPIRSLRGCTY